MTCSTPDRDGERLAGIEVVVELGSIDRANADVVHDQRVAADGGLTRAFGEVGDHQFGGNLRGQLHVRLGDRVGGRNPGRAGRSGAGDGAVGVDRVVPACGKQTERGYGNEKGAETHPDDATAPTPGSGMHPGDVDNLSKLSGERALTAVHWVVLGHGEPCGR